MAGECLGGGPRDRSWGAVTRSLVLRGAEPPAAARPDAGADDARRAGAARPRPGWRGFRATRYLPASRYAALGRRLRRRRDRMLLSRLALHRRRALHRHPVTGRRAEFRSVARRRPEL